LKQTKASIKRWWL